MAAMRHGSSTEEITRELLEKAAQLWGESRATQIHDALRVAADYLRQVSETLPQREEEPAFFL